MRDYSVILKFVCSRTISTPHCTNFNMALYYEKNPAFLERNPYKLQAAKIFHEINMYIKRDGYTIFEFDFGMDFDDDCSTRDRQSLAKVNNLRKCPEPMRKENLYTVSFYICFIDFIYRIV